MVEMRMVEMKVDLGLDQLGRILSIRYSGVITLQELRTIWMDVIDQKMVSSEIQGFILDYRNSVMDIKVEEISTLSEFFKNNLNIFQKKKFAYVTSSPGQIILPIILQEDDFFYESKPFSTTEAALEWVLN